MKLRVRLAILFTSLAFIPLALVTYTGYLSQEEELTKASLRQLVSVAEIQEKRVNEILDRYLEESKLIASRTQLRASLNEYLNTGESSHYQRVKNIIQDAHRSVQTVQRISISNSEGIVIASTDERREGEQLGQEELEIGRKTHHLYNIFRSEDNVLQVRIVGPLNLNGELVGVVEIIASASPLVAITEDYTGLGETGEVVLAKRNETGDALFLTPLRFDAGAALTRAVPKERVQVPIIPAISGQEVILGGAGAVDYRGKKVIAVTRYIESLDWGLVVKIDREEALASVGALARSYTSVIVLSVVLIIIFTFFVTRSITSPIEQLTLFAQNLRSGRFSMRTKVRSKDEVGFLASTMNTTARKLEELYQGLEQKVRERTSQLEASQEELRQNIKQLEDAKNATLNVLKDLTEAKAKDEAILASIGDGLIFTDNDRKVVLVNEAACQLTGYSEDELLGKEWPGELAGKSKHGYHVGGEWPVIEALAKNETFATARYDHSYVRKDGTTFPVSITASPVRVNKSTVGAIVVFRDVSKEVELDKAKSEFVSIASHQLRTPLTGIHWVVERLLQKHKLSKDVTDYLQDIYQSAERLAALVDQLLNVSRVEEGRVGVVPKDVNAVEFVNNYLAECRPLFDKKNLEIVFKEHPEELMIKTDHGVLRNIVQSLVSNAIEYTPDGGTIEVQLAEKDNQMVLKVSDTGIGIPEKDQAKIFQKFFRASNSQVVKTDGTGLGLYIAQQATKLLGGDLVFESPISVKKIGEMEMKIGTRFTATLPLKIEAKGGDRNLA